MGNPPKLRRAYALILVTGMVGVIFFLALAVMDFMQAHRAMLRKAENSAKALEASRAGLSLAISHLRLNPAWQEGFRDLELVPDTRSWLQFTGPDASRRSQDPGPRCLPPASVLLVCRGQSAQTVIFSESIVALNTTLLENDFSSHAKEIGRAHV